MSDFETTLSRIPPRPVPSEWRAEILRAARAVAPDNSPAALGWRRWISPQRLGFAAAWLLIAILRVSTPNGANASSPAAATVGQLEERVSTQLTLIAELLHPPAPPPQPPPPAPRCDAAAKAPTSSDLI